MRYLSLNHLVILLLLVSCGSYPRNNDLTETEIAAKKILNPYFSDPSKDYVYKAGITLQKKEFGGLFIVKKLGPDRHRVVFTTEMGNKILDFSFNGDRFIVNYLLEEMDKKILVNILKRDFKVLITEDFPVLRTFRKNNQEIFETENDKKKYYYLYRNGQLEKIIRTSGKKEKTEYLFSGVHDNTAKRIGISHKDIPLHINLFHINLKEIK